MAKLSRVRRLKYRGRNDKGERLRIPSCSHKMFKDMKMACKLSEKKDWEDATCSVCMESPHNAVLLLCSSYNKGCRPYMCATGDRFSNCLDQYKKAYSKATLGSNSLHGWPEERSEVSKLLCPLCRGQVKGWTLVEPARKYLNSKKRSCMQENCSFVGTYKELKKHVKTDHPWARPREVDPSHEEKWKNMEREREISDVMSTFSPGTVVLGDYIIDANFNQLIRDFDMDLDDLLSDDLAEAFGENRSRSGGFQLHRTSARSYDSFDDNEEEDDDGDDDVGIERRSASGRGDIVPLSRHHIRTLFLEGSRRRRRRD